MNKNKIFLTLLVLGLLLIFAYMLKINKIGFLGDDWLSLFVIKQRSPNNLIYHYSFDRPLRGFHDKYLTIILGTKIINYQILSFFYHVLDSLVLMLILVMIWPKQFRNNLTAAALALVFPGFLKQLQVFDYSAHFFSHFALMVSILIYILPIYFNKKWLYIISIPISVSLSIASIGVIEWFIGMEVLKICFVFFAFHTYQNKKKYLYSLIYSVPIIFTTGIFTYWRLFIFESKRVTVTAINMIDNISSFGSLVNTLFINLYRQIISVWFEPVRNYISYIKYPNYFIILIFGLVSLIIGSVIVFSTKNKIKDSKEEKNLYSSMMIIGGIIASAGALVPIIFGGRFIDYGNSFNRFSYPGMIGSIMVIVGLLNLVKSIPRVVILISLLTTSLLVHYGNSIWFEKNFEITRNTWWQLSWRAPNIISGTSLTGKIEYGELIESFTLWGPANLIYYPGNPDVVISAEVLDETTIDWIKDQIIFENEKRGNVVINDFSKLLLLSRNFNSCLHVINGNSPEISEFADPLIRQVAQYSDLYRIDPFSKYELLLDPDIFGPEPDHDWCYFYQKAQLARQIGDWQNIADLGNQAINNGYLPVDKIEWLVFAQGFKYSNNHNYKYVKDIILKDNYLPDEACNVYLGYNEMLLGTEFEINHSELINEFCVQ